MSKANPDYLIGSFTERKREGNIDTEKIFCVLSRYCIDDNDNHISFIKININYVYNT